MTECQRAFEDLKAYLSSPPLLSPSKSGEELFLYLAISPATVSAALVREKDEVQKPIYFTSWALRGAEEKYPPMEKLTFALLTIAYKLKPYFQAHTVIVLIDKLLRRAMSSPEVARRMALWAIELGEFNVQYLPHTAIKGAGHHWLHHRIHAYRRPGDRKSSSMEYPHGWIVHQTSRRSWCGTSKPRRGRG